MNKGFLNQRRLRFRTLVIAPMLALAVTICGPGLASAEGFSDNALHGGYGCRATLVNADGVLVQFVSDGNGKITSGIGILNFEGEVCAFTVDPAGSSDTVNADGTGTLTVKLMATVTEPDGDAAADCTAEFGGSTMHYALVVESNGQRLDVSSLDPLFTGAFFTGSDPDFAIVLSGSCYRQVGQ